MVARTSWAPSLFHTGSSSRRWFCSPPSTPATSAIQGTKAREAYLFVYTCTVCGERSERKISKRAYHHGVVLVKCPGCEKNHLVADNLKWFEDVPVNIETIMKEQGNVVWTGSVTGSTVSGEGAEGVALSVEELAEIIHIEGIDLESAIVGGDEEPVEKKK